MCKLNKAIYGLRDAGRIFFSLLHDFFISIGYSRAFKDSSVKVWRSGKDVIIVVVYVDDLTIASSDMVLMRKLKKQLNDRFEMKDLGEISFLLGMEIKRDRKRRLMTISQSKYIKDVLRQFNMLDCDAVSLPYVASLDLKKATIPQDKELARRMPYRALVGSINHIARTTRPELSFITRVLAKFLCCYDKSHWVAGLRVLRYLKGTSRMGLLFRSKSKDIVYDILTDASFANQDENLKSVTGYVLIMATAAIVWKSVTQHNITKSTMESEAMALSAGVGETEWVRYLLQELGFPQTERTNVWCDNTAAIGNVRDPTNHKGSKHVGIAYYYAQSVYEMGHIDVKWVSTEKMIADILTKLVGLKKFEQFRSDMGVRDLRFMFP